jgi:hypothetical protein
MRLIENNIARNVSTRSNRIQTKIAFRIGSITKKNTFFGTKTKFVFWSKDVREESKHNQNF